MNLLDLQFPNPGEDLHLEFSTIKQKALHEPRTVLFAEDNDDLRFVMDCVLKEIGYTVVSCCDAQVASEAFRTQSRFDLLLTDYEMPGRTGIELARELIELSPHLPVVILTGSNLPAQTLQEIEDRHWIYVSNLATCSFSKRP